MEFYRYENWAVWVSEYATEERLHEQVFYLVRETPCGWWIHDHPNYNGIEPQYREYYGKPRWVSKTARKRHAYPTRAEALENFKARKRRQIEILEHRLRCARAALEIAEGGDLGRGVGPEPLHLNFGG